jgi:hypothetical protein
MKPTTIKNILARAVTWPKAAQEELVKAAREIEEDLIHDPHFMNELEEAHREALRAEGTSLEDLKERLGF